MIEICPILLLIVENPPEKVNPKKPLTGKIKYGKNPD